MSDAAKYFSQRSMGAKNNVDLQCVLSTVGNRIYDRINRYIEYIYIYNIEYMIRESFQLVH